KGDRRLQGLNALGVWLFGALSNKTFLLVAGRPGDVRRCAPSRAMAPVGGGTARLLELSEDLPVQIEIVDLTERMGPLLTALADIIGEGLVTVRDVPILRFLSDTKA